MKELLIIAVIFAMTCLLLLFRSLILGGKQAKCYRIHQQSFDVIQTDSDDGKPSDKWPPIISQTDETAHHVEEQSSVDERIEMTLMQQRASRLLP